MNGRDLLQRTVTTIQEMYLKIGDTNGIVSLYYPVGDDAERIAAEFREAAGSEFPDTVIEPLPQRVRIIVGEKDCERMSQMPVKETMRDMTSLVKGRAPIEEFRRVVDEKYPGSAMVRSQYIDFDWIVRFPDGTDDDIYCLTEEFGQVTYHRFSKEEYLAFGYEMPVLRSKEIREPDGVQIIRDHRIELLPHGQGLASFRPCAYESLVEAGHGGDLILRDPEDLAHRVLARRLRELVAAALAGDRCH